MDKQDYFVHETAIIDDGCIIGKGSRIWHFSHLMTGCRIGEDCTVGQNVFIASDAVVGDHVKIQNNVSVYSGVICEDGVFLGPSMVFTNISNPRSAVSRRDKYEKTVVRRGATVGANATIICGNEIGEYAFVGAGAVVTKPVLPYALVTGNPARQTGWMSEYGHRLHFNEKGMAECPESHEKYRLSGGRVTKVG